jgi:hypothetical protein
VGVLSSPTVQQKYLLRPFPQFLNANDGRSTNGQSTYHSFQFRAEKRFSKGISFLAAYTNSKLITDADGPNGSTYQNLNQLKLERSLASFDVPQRLVASFSYRLPFSAAAPAVDAILSGWQVNGILSLQSGWPIGLSAGSNTSQTVGQGTVRPNSTGQSAAIEGDRSKQEKIARWFDTSAFSLPATFTFGNLSRTLPDVRTDGTKELDFSVFRDFRIREGVKLQFRAEAFNALNRVRLAAPNTVLTSPTFGQISSQANAPRQIQLALRLGF